jgi:hypothetical protein
MELWQNHWTNASWREYLAAGETEIELASIRQCTHTGRPLGTPEFVHALEESMERRLVPQKVVDEPNRARIQGNQILVFSYDETLSRSCIYNHLRLVNFPSVPELFRPRVIKTKLFHVEFSDFHVSKEHSIKTWCDQLECQLFEPEYLADEELTARVRY